MTLALCLFFRAEDGIRDFHVTGVQTCALPISPTRRSTPPHTWPTGSPFPSTSCSAAGSPLTPFATGSASPTPTTAPPLPHPRTARRRAPHPANNSPGRLRRCAHVCEMPVHRQWFDLDAMFGKQVEEVARRVT